MCSSNFRRRWKTNNKPQTLFGNRGGAFTPRRCRACTSAPPHHGHGPVSKEQRLVVDAATGVAPPPCRGAGWYLKPTASKVCSFNDLKPSTFNAGSSWWQPAPPYRLLAKTLCNKYAKKEIRKKLPITSWYSYLAISFLHLINGQIRKFINRRRAII